MKTLKWILVIPFILIILILVALLAIDPNDFKADIEQQAHEAAQLNISIEGDIDWSFLPLGINLNKISLLDQDQMLFTRFDNLTLQIDTSSLLTLSPEIHKLLLDGLNLTLIKNEDGSANWENLLPDQGGESEPQQTKTDLNKKDEAANTTNLDKSTERTISFLISEIQLSNIQIRYDDKANGQSIDINPFTLQASNIALDKAFPLSIAYTLNSRSTAANQGLDLKHTLTTDLTLSEDLSHITIANLLSEKRLQSPLFDNKTVDSKITGYVAIDTAKQTISIEDLSISLADASVSGRFDIQNYTDNLSIIGAIDLHPFSLNKLLASLGQKAIETRHADALEKVAFQSEVQLKDSQLSLDQILVQLDTSRWEGQADINLETNGLALNLKGDEINVDHYLPPSKVGSDAETKKTEQQAAKKSKAESSSYVAKSPDTTHQALLPVETIKDLDLNIQLTQSSLTFDKFPFKNVSLVFNAKGGQLHLEQANTDLFDGSIQATALIDTHTKDAQQEKVTWQGSLNTSDLNILEQLDTTKVLGWDLGGAGAINLASKFNSTGNDIAALQKSAQAKIELQILDGAITGVNLNKLACEGFASINREAISRTDWPNATQFNSLTTKVMLNGDVINSPELIVENIGLRATGEGGFNLAEQTVSYEFAINPIGDLGDEACRVHEKVRDIAIPIKCEGSLTDDPAKLCDIDYKKLGRILEMQAKKEAKRKVDKEVDRAIDKKLKKYVDEDSELGKALKEGLKGLFK